MYHKEWKTNDIIGYLQSDDYKNLSKGSHGKATVTTQLKFAWLPVRLKPLTNELEAIRPKARVY